MSTGKTCIAVSSKHVLCFADFEDVLNVHTQLSDVEVGSPTHLMIGRYDLVPSSLALQFNASRTRSQLVTREIQSHLVLSYTRRGALRGSSNAKAPIVGFEAKISDMAGQAFGIVAFDISCH